jgi:hypothetical protein
LSSCALWWLTTLIVIGVIVSWCFLGAIQLDLIKARETLKMIANNYFDDKQREIFDMNRGNSISLRHLNYLALFVGVSGAADAWLLHWSPHAP